MIVSKDVAFGLFIGIMFVALITTIMIQQDQISRINTIEARQEKIKAIAEDANQKSIENKHTIFQQVEETKKEEFNPTARNASQQSADNKSTILKFKAKWIKSHQKALKKAIFKISRFRILLFKIFNFLQVLLLVVLLTFLHFCRIFLAGFDFVLSCF